MPNFFLECELDFFVVFLIPNNLKQIEIETRLGAGQVFLLIPDI